MKLDLFIFPFDEESLQNDFSITRNYFSKLRKNIPIEALLDKSSFRAIKSVYDIVGSFEYISLL